MLFALASISDSLFDELVEYEERTNCNSHSADDDKQACNSAVIKYKQNADDNQNQGSNERKHNSSGARVLHFKDCHNQQEYSVGEYCDTEDKQHILQNQVSANNNYYTYGKLYCADEPIHIKQLGCAEDDKNSTDDRKQDAHDILCTHNKEDAEDDE